MNVSTVLSSRIDKEDVTSQSEAPNGPSFVFCFLTGCLESLTLTAAEVLFGGIVDHVLRLTKKIDLGKRQREAE